MGTAEGTGRAKGMAEGMERGKDMAGGTEDMEVEGMAVGMDMGVEDMGVEDMVEVGMDMGAVGMGMGEMGMGMEGTRQLAMTTSRPRTIRAPAITQHRTRAPRTALTTSRLRAKPSSTRR